MPREKKQFSNVREWGNVASVVREGQGHACLRSESQDHPCNTVPVPDVVMVYTAKNQENRDKFDRYVAYMEVEGKRTVIQSGETRKKLEDSLAFDRVYSHYAPSCYYRSFRSLCGFDYHSSPYQTKVQKKEGQDRCLKALAVMAGADPATVDALVK